MRTINLSEMYFLTYIVHSLFFSGFTKMITCNVHEKEKRKNFKHYPPVYSIENFWQFFSVKLYLCNTFENVHLLIINERKGFLAFCLRWQREGKLRWWKNLFNHLFVWWFQMIGMLNWSRIRYNLFYIS